MEQKLNRLLHQENLRLLDGKYWHGRYYRQGIGQPTKEPPPKNAVFNMKGEIIFRERKMF